MTRACRVECVKVDILHKWRVSMFIIYATTKRFNCGLVIGTELTVVDSSKQETKQGTEALIPFLFQRWIGAKIRVASATQMRLFVT